MASVLLFFCVMAGYTSCSTSSPWVLQEQDSFNEFSSLYASQRLVYTPKNTFSGIGIEIIKSDKGYITYLNIFSGILPAHTRDVKKIVVTMKTEAGETSFVADRLQGGQKIRLTEEAEKSLHKSLSSGEELSIAFGRYNENFPDIMVRYKYFFPDSFNP